MDKLKYIYETVDVAEEYLKKDFSELAEEDIKDCIETLSVIKKTINDYKNKSADELFADLNYSAATTTDDALSDVVTYIKDIGGAGNLKYIKEIRILKDNSVEAHFRAIDKNTMQAEHLLPIALTSKDLKAINKKLDELFGEKIR